MYGYTPHVCLVSTSEARRGHQILETGTVLPCVYWGLNSALLEEQTVLLAVKPALQSLLLNFKLCVCVYVEGCTWECRCAWTPRESLKFLDGLVGGYELTVVTGN